jgi:hypothetical protein
MWHACSDGSDGDGSNGSDAANIINMWHRSWYLLRQPKLELATFLEIWTKIWSGDSCCRDMWGRCIVLCAVWIIIHTCHTPRSHASTAWLYVLNEAPSLLFKATLIFVKLGHVLFCSRGTNVDQFARIDSAITVARYNLHNWTKHRPFCTLKCCLCNFLITLTDLALSPRYI